MLDSHKCGLGRLVSLETFCREGRVSQEGNSGSVLTCSASTISRTSLSGGSSQPLHTSHLWLLKYQGLSNPRSCSFRLCLQGQNGETTTVPDSPCSTAQTSINGNTTAATSGIEKPRNPFASIFRKSLLSYLCLGLSDKINIHITAPSLYCIVKDLCSVLLTRCLAVLDQGLAPSLCGHNSYFSLWAHSHLKLFTRALSSSKEPTTFHQEPNTHRPFSRLRSSFSDTNRVGGTPDANQKTTPCHLSASLFLSKQLQAMTLCSWRKAESALSPWVSAVYHCTQAAFFSSKHAGSRTQLQEGSQQSHARHCCQWHFTTTAILPLKQGNETLLPPEVFLQLSLPVDILVLTAQQHILMACH